MTHGDAMADALLHRLAPALQGRPQRGFRPAFLVPYIEMHNAIVRAGGAVACMHVDLTSTGQIRHIATWVPGRVVCTACAANNALSVDPHENWLCDRCLQHKPGRVSASVLRAGPWLLWFGVCRDCHADMLTGGEL